MRLAYRQFDLPLRHPFRISRGEVTVQSTLIVELSHAGHYGYGEATTNRYYGTTIENMSAAIESARHTIEAAAVDEPTKVIAALGSQLAGHSFALSALDQAAHDLWGKLQDKPLYSLWNLSLNNLPRSCFTLGIDTPERMAAKLAESPGWPVYKVKLGTADDLGIVRELRRHTRVPFRVDANAGWTVEQALAMAPELKTLGVEFIEQPLPAADRDGAQYLFERSPLPLFADESCVGEADVEDCVGLFHGINIKLVKCGGLAAARRMIDRSRELGMKLMIGCMTESTVGISAAAQLLPLVDYVDLDGAALLATDIATGVEVVRGKCIFPTRGGTGVHFLGPPLSSGA